MNKRDRIKATLQGEAVDRPIVSFWRHFYQEETSGRGLAEVVLGFPKRLSMELFYEKNSPTPEKNQPKVIVDNKNR